MTVSLADKTIAAVTAFQEQAATTVLAIEAAGGLATPHVWAQITAMVRAASEMGGAAMVLAATVKAETK